MQEQIDAWLKQFEAENGRKPTVQEFQDAKKQIELRMEMARMRDADKDTPIAEPDSKPETQPKTQKEVPKSQPETRKHSKPKKRKWVLIVGGIVLLIAIIAAAFTFGRSQGQSSQPVASSSSKKVAKAKPKAKKKAKSNSSSSSSVSSSSSSASSSSDSNKLTKTDLENSKDLMNAAIVYYYFKDATTPGHTPSNNQSYLVDNGAVLSVQNSAMANLNDAGDVTYSFNETGTGSGGVTYFSINGNKINYYVVTDDPGTTDDDNDTHDPDSSIDILGMLMQINDDGDVADVRKLANNLEYDN